MYESCWIGADSTLELIIVVLVVVVIGAICAAERNAAAARRYRRLWTETAMRLNEARADLAQARFARTFTNQAAE